MLYYSLCHGLGETKTCSTESDSLCLPWQNKHIWSTFSSITKNTRRLGYDMQTDWVVIQVLLPLSVCLCAIAIYLHSVVEFSNKSSQSPPPQRSTPAATTAASSGNTNTISYHPSMGNNISQELLKSLQWKINYATIGANLIFLLWICLLICINFNRSSMTMSSALWTNFYNGKLL